MLNFLNEYTQNKARVSDKIPQLYFYCLKTFYADKMIKEEIKDKRRNVYNKTPRTICFTLDLNI